MLKTTLTPAEHANVSQGLEFLDSLTCFVKNEAAVAASEVIGAKTIREPLAVKEVIVSLVDPGDAGANSDTFVDVLKNGVTILSAPVGIPDEAAAGVTVIALPASDALATLEPGDRLTVAMGADLGDIFVGLSVEVRLAKRFA